ncbi:MAG: manganese-binding transcriptional regulator MntR [Planctomycetota bacterium]
MPPSTPPSKAPATGHRRTRADHAAETAEDYVEAIADRLDTHGTCRVVDLAEQMGVSHVTVVRVVQRLTAEGLVDTQPYKPLNLTPAGRRLATACRQRHETVVAFLRKLGVSAKVAAIDAEGIEHHLSSQTLKRMRDFIDQ